MPTVIIVALHHWTNNDKQRIEVFQFDFILTFEGNAAYGATWKQLCFVLFLF